MNCIEFETRLATVVENAGDVEAAEFREHATHCDRCREMWERERIVDQAIAHWRAASLEADLSDAVIGRLRETGTLVAATCAATPEDSEVLTRRSGARTTSAGPRRLPTFIAGMIAAAVLLTLIVAINARRPFNDVAVETSPPQPRGIATDGELNQPTPRIDRFVRDASTASLDLAQDAAQAMGDLSLLVPRVDTILASHENEQRLDGAEDDWSKNLKPIRDGVGQAIDFLMRAVPDESTPAT